MNSYYPLINCLSGNKNNKCIINRKNKLKIEIDLSVNRMNFGLNEFISNWLITPRSQIRDLHGSFFFFIPMGAPVFVTSELAGSIAVQNQLLIEHSEP